MQTNLFHKKGFALGFVLKVRVFGTRKWQAYWKSHSLQRRPHTHGLMSLILVIVIAFLRGDVNLKALGTHKHVKLLIIRRIFVWETLSS